MTEFVLDVLFATLPARLVAVVVGAVLVALLLVAVALPEADTFQCCDEGCSYTVSAPLTCPVGPVAPRKKRA